MDFQHVQVLFVNIQHHREAVKIKTSQQYEQEGTVSIRNVKLPTLRNARIWEFGTGKELCKESIWSIKEYIMNKVSGHLLSVLWGEMNSLWFFKTPSPLKMPTIVLDKTLKNKGLPWAINPNISCNSTNSTVHGSLRLNYVQKLYLLNSRKLRAIRNKGEDSRRGCAITEDIV